MLVSDLFHARGVYMKESISLLQTGHFPVFENSGYHKIMFEAMTNIFSSNRFYQKVWNNYNVNNDMTKDLENISNIRNINREKYDLYLQKLIGNYRSKIANISYYTYIYERKHNVSVYEESITLKLLPEKQTLRVKIEKIPTFSLLDPKPTVLYDKEFSADTPISSIKENIEYFYKNRDAKSSLEELENKYK